MKYEWVPHEVRRDQAESIVAYALVALAVIAAPIGLMVLVLHAY